MKKLSLSPASQKGTDIPVVIALIPKDPNKRLAEKSVSKK
jgi:hypothetical protein